MRLDWLRGVPHGPGGLYVLRVLRQRRVCHRRLLYIPKGTLCTTLEWGLENAYGETWFYQTESGAVVEIGTDTVQGAPSYILYESPNAWVLYLYGNQDLEPYRLEGIADRYDFGQFA